MHGRRVPRLFLVVAVLAATVFTLGVIVSVPPLGGPDESAHLGYAAFLNCERRLPVPLVDDVGFQHPPLYHAFLAAALAALPADRLDARVARSGLHELDLPYEKRVALDLDATNIDLCHSYLPDRTSRPHQIREVLVVIWRLTGIPLLLLTAAFLVFGMRSLGPEHRVLAALSAGIAIVVPGFGVSFATLNNDQFGILFSTIATAVVLCGVRSGRASLRHLVAAGIFGACALLSKLTAVGPLAGCAVWVFFSTAGLKERAKALAALLLPPAAAGAWWIGRIGSLTGTFDVVRLTGERWPHIFRDVVPDASGYADVLATVATTWIGNVGYDAIEPSRPLVLAGLAIPAITLFGSLVALLSRGAPRQARIAAGAFLVALLVQVAALLWNNRHSFHTHGRYLQPLTLLGATALCFGARELFGAKARLVLAACVTLLALTGLDLLHGRLLPSYWPPRDRYASPDFAAYVDAGLPTHARFVEQGIPLREPAWGAKPQGSMLTHPQEVKLKVTGLDPRGTYVAWIRLHPPSRAVAIQDFLADGMPLGGPHSVVDFPDWKRFLIPRGATADGSVTISAHGLLGHASIAELLVTKRPIEVAAVAAKDGGAFVSLRSSAPERLPALEAALRAKDGAVSARRRVEFGKDGVAELVFAGPSVPTQLLLFEPEIPWLDIKLAPFAMPIVEKRGALGSPGIDVARVPAGVPADAVLFKLPEAGLPPGDYRSEILDEHGKPLPAGRLAVIAADNAVPGEIRYSGGAPFVVDRLRLWHSEPHVFELEPR